MARRSSTATATDANLVTVSGDIIQIHDADTAAWWQLRPGTPLPLCEIF